MSMELAYEIYYIELYHIFSIILSISLNLYLYLKAHKTSVLKWYLAVQILILIWMISKVFKTVSPNVDIRWFFIVTQYFANCFLGSFFLIFAYLYNFNKPLRLRYIFFINIPSAFFFIAMATNPYHMLFYSYYDFYRDSFGPLFYIHQVFSYSFILTGIIMCVRNFRQQYKYKRIQARLIALAILIPLLFNILYITKLFKKVFGSRPLFDYTPIACSISLIIFAYAAFKHYFLDIRLIAQRKALDQSLDGIIILDKNKYIIDYNSTFLKYFNSFYPIKTYTDFNSFIDYFLSFSKGNGFNDLRNRIKDKKSSSISIILNLNQILYLTVEIQPVFQRKKYFKGYCLRFIDVTEQYEILKKLSNKTQELGDANLKLEERANTIRNLTLTKLRNYIAHELHDILGHSFVLVISILEVSILTYENSIEMTRERILQAIEIVRRSKCELEAVLLKNNSKEYACHKIIDQISSISREFESSGIEIDFTLQGSPFDLPKNHSENIYRICQESVTNSVRHGKANKISIILRFISRKYEIFILDNGKGCTKNEKGYGLSGMEARINTLNGSIKYGTTGESGFNIHVKVPV